jgi:hypothetical protein
VTKPEKTPLTFSPPEWVQLTDAFLRIMSFTRRRELALRCLNRDLLSGKLKSALVKILPDSKVTMTLLKRSDWRQLTLQVPLRPQEGVGVQPYMDGDVYVWAADLDKHYSITATPTAQQSDDTESSPQTTPEKQKPGIRATKDWPNSLLPPEIVRVAYETPDLLLLGNRPELVRHVRKFLKDNANWEPADNKPIHRELNRLLSRIKNSL